MQPTIRYTTHAAGRSARRNLSDDDVEFVLAHGRRVHRAGALHVFLAGRDIPADKAIVRRYGHLEGTMLVLSEDSGELVLITAYRNRRGFKAARTKSPYDRRARWASYTLTEGCH